MKPDVSKFNVSTFFLIQAAWGIGLTFMNTFLSFIVKDPRYYDIPKSELAQYLGNLTFIAELFIIPSHLLLGGLMDAVGRKWPTVIGLMVSGVCIALIPLGRSIYPTLCILR
jgi:MFS family permease